MTTPKRPNSRRHNSGRDSVEILRSIQRERKEKGAAGSPHKPKSQVSRKKPEEGMTGSPHESRSPILRRNPEDEEVIRREWSPPVSPHFHLMEEEETRDR